MNVSDTQALWRELKAAGLVAGEPPPPGAITAPWFVRVMLGIAGWIGALFLLGFVSLGFRALLESPGVSFVAGLMACAAAGVLFRTKPDSDFATQFGLAMSLAGQGLVLIALGKELHNQAGLVALSMSLVQAILFFAIPNFVHRVWAAWTGAYAIVFALTDWHLQVYAPGLLAMAFAWIWLNEFRHASHGAMLRAGGYGLIPALMGAVGMVASAAGTWMWRAGIHRPAGSEFHVWIGAGLCGIALLWAVWRLLMREDREPASGTNWPILVAAGVLALANFKAPGLAPATLILLLGYANGNRVLSGLGVAALLGYLPFYYYSLEATLLYKSVLMMATGAVLLVARVLLQKYWPSTSRQEDRHA